MNKEKLAALELESEVWGIVKDDNRRVEKMKLISWFVNSGGVTVKVETFHKILVEKKAEEIFATAKEGYQALVARNHKRIANALEDLK